jgi:hypothetical protein
MGDLVFAEWKDMIILIVDSRFSGLVSLVRDLHRGNQPSEMSLIRDFLNGWTIDRSPLCSNRLVV